MKFLIVVVLICAQSVVWAENSSCTATVQCKFGSASCSASPQAGAEVFCGQRIPGDRFLSCGQSIAGGLVKMKAAICCDSMGTALSAVESKDGALKTSSCAGLGAD
ncbi:MAG: hypothetical protein KF681_00670 [Bdellovibrionaceae bacterium]|nr:hypothetical protein [Pseudobdellovibrionaceae bacterium]